MNLGKKLRTSKQAVAKPSRQMSLSPVSHAIDIEFGPRGKIMKYALSVIDKVHTDGRLPRIQANTDSALDVNGSFSTDENDVPVGILINPTGPSPELTCLHEIGHFLDHQALDQSGTMASEGSAILADWWTAVTQSQAIQTLARRQSQTLTGINLPNDVLVRVVVNKEQVEYFLRPYEIFARSYAQFVTTLSKDQLLSSQLAGILVSQEWQVYPKQWTEQDFEPIMESLKQVFRQKGWMQ